MTGPRGVLVRPRRGGTAARPAGRDDNDFFRAFVSFASLDNARTKTCADGEVERFVADLRDMFARVSGRTPGLDFDFFLSSASILPGDPWLSVLNREISAADVFVPILSPSYFNSDWCAREWGAFNLRPRGSGDPASGLVVPIRWMACTALPAVAAAIQIPSFDNRDPDPGIRRLMVSAPQRYDEELETLARQLRDASEQARRTSRHNLKIENAPAAFPIGTRV